MKRAKIASNTGRHPNELLGSVPDVLLFEWIVAVFMDDPIRISLKLREVSKATCLRVDSYLSQFFDLHLPKGKSSNSDNKENTRGISTSEETFVTDDVVGTQVSTRSLRNRGEACRRMMLTSEYLGPYDAVYFSRYTNDDGTRTYRPPNLLSLRTRITSHVRKTSNPEVWLEYMRSLNYVYHILFENTAFECPCNSCRQASRPQASFVSSEKSLARFKHHHFYSVVYAIKILIRNRKTVSHAVLAGSSFERSSYAWKDCARDNQEVEAEKLSFYIPDLRCVCRPRVKEVIVSNRGDDWNPFCLENDFMDSPMVHSPAVTFEGSSPVIVRFSKSNLQSPDGIQLMIPPTDPYPVPNDRKGPGVGDRKVGPLSMSDGVFSFVDRGSGSPTVYQFTNLTYLEFGRTIDTRHVQEFINSCWFPKLRTVKIGMLSATYSIFPPQFGLVPLFVFSPTNLLRDEKNPEMQHLPAIYSGKTDKEQKLTGLGVYACPIYIYEGHFQSGLNQHYGKMRANTGETYEGLWFRGLRCGHGRVIQKDGCVMEGTWFEDLLHGKGYILRFSGLFYIGRWYHSRWDGWGLIAYQGRLVAYGQFKHGQLDGWARVFNHDVGGWEDGWWNNGKRVTGKGPNAIRTFYLATERGNFVWIRHQTTDTGSFELPATKCRPTEEEGFYGIGLPPHPFAVCAGRALEKPIGDEPLPSYSSPSETTVRMGERTASPGASSVLHLLDRQMGGSRGMNFDSRLVSGQDLDNLVFTPPYVESAIPESVVIEAGAETDGVDGVQIRIMNFATARIEEARSPSARAHRGLSLFQGTDPSPTSNTIEVGSESIEGVDSPVAGSSNISFNNGNRAAGECSPCAVDVVYRRQNAMRSIDEMENMLRALHTVEGHTREGMPGEDGDSNGAYSYTSLLQESSDDITSPFIGSSDDDNNTRRLAFDYLEEVGKAFDWSGALVANTFDGGCSLSETLTNAKAQGLRSLVRSELTSPHVMMGGGKPSPPSHPSWLPMSAGCRYKGSVDYPSAVMAGTILPLQMDDWLAEHLLEHFAISDPLGPLYTQEFYNLSPAPFFREDTLIDLRKKAWLLHMNRLRPQTVTTANS